MIYDILPVNNYQGNNSATTFDFDFYIENKSQLNVFLFDNNGTKTQLQVDVDYSINELKNENGSYITFPIAGSSYGVLNEEQKISLELTLPISQETQYNNSSLLNLQALEYSLDYLTRLIQILYRKLALCIKVEECSSNTPDDLLESINQANINSTLKALEAQKQAALALERLNLIINQADIINQKKLEVESLVSSQLPLINMIPNSILSAPNGIMTFEDATLTLHQGLRVLIPDGLNADGSLKNIDLTLAQDAIYTETGAETEFKFISVNEQGYLRGYMNYFEQEENPGASHSLWYKPSENKMYKISDDIETPTVVKEALIGKYGANEGAIAKVYHANAVNLALKEDLDGQWVSKNVTLAVNVNVPVGNKTFTYDLSNYLPDDGAVYEVAFSSRGTVKDNAQAGSYAEYRLSSAYWTTTIFTVQSWVAGKGLTGSGMAFAPIGPDRIVKILTTVTNQGPGLLQNFIALGYRKVR